MEKRKINNWEQLLKMMIGSWFDFRGIRQRIINVEFHKYQAEVKTSAHTHFFKHDEINTILHEWIPVEHEGVTACNFMAHAIYEGDLQVVTNNVISTHLDTTNSINDVMVAEAYMAHFRHQQENNKINAAMDHILTELTKGGVPSVHIIKTAETVSQFSKDRVNMQLSEIKMLALLQKAIEDKNKSNTNQPKNEDSSPDKKD